MHFNFRLDTPDQPREFRNSDFEDFVATELAYSNSQLPAVSHLEPSSRHVGYSSAPKPRSEVNAATESINIKEKYSVKEEIANLR